MANPKTPKTPKTPPGIKQLPDGRYRLLATTTDPRTKRKLYAERTLDQGATLGQAVDARAEMIAELRSEQTPSRKEAPPTLGVYSRSWLELHAERVQLRTLEVYKTRLVCHILPYLGALPLAEIQRRDLERYLTILETAPLNQKAKRPLGARTQVGVWGLLLDVLRDACVDFNLLDPSRRLKGPRVQVKPAGRALSREQLGAFTRAALDRPLGSGSYVLTLAYTGLRRTEAARLRREDLDLASLDDAWLTVGKSKTLAGQGRRVPLPRICAEALERHLATAPTSPWVWPNKGDASRPMHEASAHYHVEAAGLAAGLGLVSPHDLRRTYTTLANRAGVDRLALQAILGHTNPATTDIYIRTSDEDRRKVLTLLVG